MTNLQNAQKLLAESLAQLWEAMNELAQPTFPQTPLPRPPAKPIRLARQLELRVEVDDGVIVRFYDGGVCFDRWGVAKGARYGGVPSNVIGTMVRRLSHPRALAHCLRQLRWLTAWMRKRAEGRRRAAAEILRQQREWVEELESEIAMHKLAE